jgi:hypothetical protein
LARGLKLRAYKPSACLPVRAQPIIKYQKGLQFLAAGQSAYIFFFYCIPRKATLCGLA